MPWQHYIPTKDYNKPQEKLKGMSPQQLQQFYEGLEKEGYKYYGLIYTF